MLDFDEFDLLDMIECFALIEWLVARTHQFEPLFKFDDKHEFVHFGQIVGRLILFDVLDGRVVDCGVHLEERDDGEWDSLLGLGLQVEHVGHCLSEQFMIV